ncbi:TolC family protein [Aureibacter tunicatorum]|uniref:Outer membrane protein TolC n=1 Tax=Aureibacter tunicatorum TaxID=866807 RepID=A0AAE3XJZ2_9BACT|nr:TolC family protein [Aureibacter tunicatorum]MDR6238292.1 outer membrane protein TolC [Aureibacter tunicatorum]BDD03325.1 transporter [Aureibacter tunicatorum]
MRDMLRALLLALVIYTLSISRGFAQESSQQQTSVKMSLQECVDFALENHVDIINAEIEQRIAKAKVGETRAIGLPQINAAGGINNNYKLGKAVFDTPDGVQEVTFGSKYDGNLQLSGSQLLFDGTYIVGLKAANVYTDLTDKQLISTKIDRVQAVMESYYQILISETRLDAFESNLNRLDTTLRETTLLYENGFAEKIDVDRIKVNYNNVKTEINKVERLIDFSYMNLKYQIGMPLENQISLSSELIDPGVMSLVDESFQKADPEMRIEYQELGVNIRLADLDMKQFQMQYLPQVSLVGNYGWNGIGQTWTQINTFAQPSWFGVGAIGLQVKLPIFEGGRKPYAVRQARLKKLQLENQKKLLAQGIQVEIKQNRDQLLAAFQDAAFQEENVELATSVVYTTRQKYVEGIGSNLELITAENDLTQAQINYYNSLYESIVAYIALQKAMGILY